MKFCIPTYKRAQLLAQRTYPLLKSYGIPDESIVLYVVAEEQEEYRKTFPFAQIVVGVKGLVPQRRFIYDDAKMDEEIMMLDDDLIAILGEGKKPVPDLVALCKRGFEECRRHGLRLWSVSPTDNSYFYKNEVSTHLKFCIGSFYGIVKQGQMPFQADCLADCLKEDYYRTCAYYKQDGGVVRLNWAGVKTSYLRGAGGLQETRTLERELEAAQTVVKAFPDYATLYTRKRTGRPEIRLRAPHKKKTTGFPRDVDQPQSPDSCRTASEDHSL